MPESNEHIPEAWPKYTVQYNTAYLLEHVVLNLLKEMYFINEIL